MEHTGATPVDLKRDLRSRVGGKKRSNNNTFSALGCGAERMRTGCMRPVVKCVRVETSSNALRTSVSSRPENYNYNYNKLPPLDLVLVIVHDN